MEKKSLDLNEIIEILGDRPFEMKQHFKEFLETKNQMQKEMKQKLETV